MLVVGVTAEHSSSSCQASTVTYGGQSLTKIAQAVCRDRRLPVREPLVPARADRRHEHDHRHLPVVDHGQRRRARSGSTTSSRPRPDASNSSYNNAGATLDERLHRHRQLLGGGRVRQRPGPRRPRPGRGPDLALDEGRGRRVGGMSTKPVADDRRDKRDVDADRHQPERQVVAAFAPAPSATSSTTTSCLLKGGAPVGHRTRPGRPAGRPPTRPSPTAPRPISGERRGPRAEVNASNFGVRLQARTCSSTASNTASVDYVTVTVYYEPLPTSSIGTSGTPVAQANIGGTCTLGAAAAHTPCTSADNVFASSISTTRQNLGKPTIDLDYWWQNAKPGPKHPCTTSSGQRAHVRQQRRARPRRTTEA